MTDRPTPPKAPWWPLLALIVTGVVLLMAGLFFQANVTVQSQSVSIIYGLGTLVAYGAVLSVTLIGANRFRKRAWVRVLALLEGHTQAIESLPERRLGLWILLASAAGLFVELALIRMHSTNFAVFSFYKNLSLLAAFLGLGIGYAAGARRPLFTPIVLPALALQFALLHVLRSTSLQTTLRNPVSEQLAMGLNSLQSFAHVGITYGLLLLVFLATVLTCIPLGHLASAIMSRRRSLVAYSWNLGGSLLGIGLLTLLSHLWSPPAVWLLAATAMLVPFLLPRNTSSVWPLTTGLGAVAIALVVLLAPSGLDRVQVHSPYQPVAVKHERGRNPQLVTNRFYQVILDLRGKGLDSPAAYYDFPYRFKPQAQRVLVVGAGTGNDVSAALRAGSKHVDAVEIDPAILAFGRAIHPEKPYQDPRVEAFVADARDYLRTTERRYDLVVYGLLDSHATLSSLSSVRLDSFVYTVEGIRDALSRLNDDGLICMTFALLSQEQGEKFFLMIKQACDGVSPRVFTFYYSGAQNYLFLAGPGLAGTLPTDLPFRDATAFLEAASAKSTVDVSTDDWPFVYMPRATFPLSYVGFLLAIALTSFALIWQLVPGARKSFSPTCFFLGTGFMLIETKGITELALYYGTTWHVVSAVIVAILILAFAANLIVDRIGSPRPIITYSLLVGSLLLGLGLAGSMPGGTSGRVLVTVLVTLPVFFSGFAFSSELLRPDINIGSALSSNLLGGMLGGLLEYNSMQFGYKSLYLLAIAVYVLAFLATRRR